jgi:hypothetical protein
MWMRCSGGAMRRRAFKSTNLGEIYYRWWNGLLFLFAGSFVSPNSISASYSYISLYFIRLGFSRINYLFAELLDVERSIFEHWRIFG